MRASKYNEFFYMTSKIRNIVQDSEELYTGADVEDLKEELEQLLVAVNNLSITEEYED